MAINWSGKFVAASFSEMAYESQEISDATGVAVSPASMANVVSLADGVAQMYGYEFLNMQIIPGQETIFIFREIAS